MRGGLNMALPDPLSSLYSGAAIGPGGRLDRLPGAGLVGRYSGSARRRFVIGAPRWLTGHPRLVGVEMLASRTEVTQRYVRLHGMDGFWRKNHRSRQRRVGQVQRVPVLRPPVTLVALSR